MVKSRRSGWKLRGHCMSRGTRRCRRASRSANRQREECRPGRRRAQKREGTTDQCRPTCMSGGRERLQYLLFPLSRGVATRECLPVCSWHFDVFVYVAPTVTKWLPVRSRYFDVFFYVAPLIPNLLCHKISAIHQKKYLAMEDVFWLFASRKGISGMGSPLTNPFR